MAKREPDFKSEADLCAAFSEWLGRRHPEWIAYAETEGWDILLAHADGTQIGIQAKLKFNLAVLSQAVEDGHGWSETGPDYRAILTPQGESDAHICDVLGLVSIQSSRMGSGKFEFYPDLVGRQRWHYCNPAKRHQLPKYVPDVPAGVPGPCSLTRWKIAALQISAILELRGCVNRQAFRLAGIDHRRWTQQWLEPVPEKPGSWRWRDGVNQGFQHQHPTIYPKVLEEVRANGVAEETALI